MKDSVLKNIYITHGFKKCFEAAEIIEGVERIVEEGFSNESDCQNDIMESIVRLIQEHKTRGKYLA